MIIRAYLAFTLLVLMLLLTVVSTSASEPPDPSELGEGTTKTWEGGGSTDSGNVADDVTKVGEGSASTQSQAYWSCVGTTWLNNTGSNPVHTYSVTECDTPMPYMHLNSYLAKKRFSWLPDALSPWDWVAGDTNECYNCSTNNAGGVFSVEAGRYKAVGQHFHLTPNGDEEFHVTESCCTDID